MFEKIENEKCLKQGVFEYENDDKTPILFMMVGLSGSGKSYIAERLKEVDIDGKSTHPSVYSSDKLREELFGDENDQTHNEKLFIELHRRMKDDLRNGKSVIYDATNISKKRRRAFLEELSKIECKKVCVCVLTPYEVCLSQNSKRERKVPDEVIRKMYLNWCPPSYDEGFDDITLIYNYGENNKKYDIGNFFYGEINAIEIDQENSHHKATIGNHCIEAAEYIEKNESNRSSLTLCFEWSEFWNCFKYIPAEDFEKLKEKVIEKLCEHTNRKTAEELYYPNAFSMVSNISAKSEVSERTVDKKTFIEELKSKESLLITKWTLAGLDKKKLLQSKKQHLSELFSLNTAIRAFVFSEQFYAANEDKIIPFVQEYIAKYYKKKTLQRPPLFIFENGADICQKVILGLHSYQKSVNSGFVGNVFMADSFINNTDCAESFVCKVSSLQNINVGIMESCNVNQVYIIGSIKAELSSSKYNTVQIEIDKIEELRYLVNLDRKLEVS